MTLEQQLESGISHHQAGRLTEAEGIYRQILAQQPNHADALHLLGVIAAQVGRFDAAVELIRRAIAIYPNHPAYYGNIGNALKQLSRLDEAIAAYRQAIHLKPDYIEALDNLGEALTIAAKHEEAIPIRNASIQANPSSPEAHHNLGANLAGCGRTDEAIAAYRRALQLKPDFPQANYGLGCALASVGQRDAAFACFKRAIELKPDFVQAIVNFGAVLADSGDLDGAIAAQRRAIQIDPRFAEAFNNLGVASIGKWDVDTAVSAYQKAISLKPDMAEAHVNLGVALEKKFRLDDALAAVRQAIRLRPDFAGAHNNLGNVLKDLGRIDEAIASYRKAVQLKPDFTGASSNSIYSLYFHPDYDSAMIYEAHRRWNAEQAEPLGKSLSPYENDPNPNRRLRIGYVSPDFREHCQSFFTIPLLSNHDRENFEIFCYTSLAHGDAFTERIRGYAHGWQSIVGMSDADAAQKIREDRIDILVDLTMHMAGSRPLIFARKPAPVQVAWLAYPGTTGMSAMDYRLTDPYLDPPGVGDQFSSEKSIRLPDTFWCYDPLIEDLEVNSLPAQSNGYVTFGCLNNFCKINEQVLHLWALVLSKVERSRMIILCPEGSARRSVLDVLKNDGIDPARIELTAFQPRRRYLEIYHRIDLGLDTIPYNGHTTSLDSYWMGVPVITLVGNTVVGRAGLSQLTNLALPELIAQTPQQYVQIAADLAQDRPRLSDLRRALRGRLRASALMGAPRFARNIDAAYRQMWAIWRQTAPTFSA